LQEAVREFEGTSEEVSIMVADCEASIAGGDVSGALQRLKGVPETSPHYVRACIAMAEIHLKHRKDSSAYIKCYLHLVVSQQPGDVRKDMARC
jgi:tetratricopeptide repeat protein 21B